MADDENMDKMQLLDFLLSKGTTPSFSFPLEVCKFVAEGMDQRKKKIWAETDQDIRVALSEYVPGKVLTINKVDYRVGGLYFVFPPDIVNRAKHMFEQGMASPHLKYYNFCITDGCGWVHKNVEEEIGDKECPVCGIEDSVETKRYFRPEGFSPVMVSWNTYNDEAKTTQKQKGRDWVMKAAAVTNKQRESAGGRIQLPAPLMTEEEGNVMQEHDLTKVPDFDGYSTRMQLFSSNRDSIGEVGVELILINSGYHEKGFYICSDCGRAEVQDSTELLKPHNRPYGGNTGWSKLSKEDFKELCGLCEGTVLGDNDTGEPILLGTTFRSDLITFRIRINSPLIQTEKLMTDREFNGGILAIKEALITEIQKKMEYVNREIGGGVRKFTQRNGDQKIRYAEIFLYDQVSGGAGLVTGIPENLPILPTIFDNVERRLSGKTCTGKIPCDRACVGCLLDFRNKREHEKLDRVNGLRILRYLKEGRAPTPDFISKEQFDNDDPGNIQALAERINAAAESLKVSIEKPDGSHAVIVIESPSTKKSIRIRPISSVINRKHDPIVKFDGKYRTKLKIDISIQDREKGCILYRDLNRNYTRLIRILNSSLSNTPQWS
jgi:hypothetical protein